MDEHNEILEKICVHLLRDHYINENEFALSLSNHNVRKYDVKKYLHVNMREQLDIYLSKILKYTSARRERLFTWQLLNYRVEEVANLKKRLRPPRPPSEKKSAERSEHVAGSPPNVPFRKGKRSKTYRYKGVKRR